MYNISRKGSIYNVGFVRTVNALIKEEQRIADWKFCRRSNDKDQIFLTKKCAQHKILQDLVERALN